MAIETVTITASAETWTELSDGHANVLVKLHQPANVFLFAGQVIPADPPPTQIHHVTMDGSQPLSLGSMEAGDKVWIFCFKEIKVEVIRG